MGTLSLRPCLSLLPSSRIYRSGFLHFHERDLAKSLLLFAINPTDDCVPLTMEETLLAKEIIYVSAASHFKSFSSLSESINGYAYDMKQLKEQNYVK
jgi:hypothetical protein